MEPRGHRTARYLQDLGDLVVGETHAHAKDEDLASGRGETLDGYLKQSRFVVEGVATTRSVMDLAARYRVEMPITQAVHAVLFEGVDPIAAIGQLMSRDLKSERIG